MTSKSLNKRIKKLETKVAKNKPEKKMYDVNVNLVVPKTGGTRFDLLPLTAGVGSGGRIGHDVKAVSYYGIFYFSSNNSAVNNNCIRLVHYWDNERDRVLLENQGGTQMFWNNIPTDSGVSIIEDKLIPLSPNTGGISMRKVVLKGTYKFGRNAEWDDTTSANPIGPHPYLYVTSNTDAGNERPTINGQMRYYYTDL